MTDERRAILSHVLYIRDELEGGRLTNEQAGLYTQLGRRITWLTDLMDAATNPDEANELWREGADTIREFLTEHFPRSRPH